MPSSSFLLSPTDLTTRFCYVNFEVGHKLADCPVMSFVFKRKQKGFFKNKTKITNNLSQVINSPSHNLTI